MFVCQYLSLSISIPNRAPDTLCSVCFHTPRRGLRTPPQHLLHSPSRCAGTHDVMTASKPLPNTFSLSLSSPPTPPPCNPRVVPVYQPADRPDEIQRTQNSPPAAQLPEHPIDTGRPLEPAVPPDGPRGSSDLFASQAQRLDAAFLVRADCHAFIAIVPFNPSRASSAEFALAVVHKGQPGIRHRPKLH